MTAPGLLGSQAAKHPAAAVHVEMHWDRSVAFRTVHACHDLPRGIGNRDTQVLDVRHLRPWAVSIGPLPQQVGLQKQSVSSPTSAGYVKL